MAKEFKGIIKDEDMTIFKHALTHLKERLLFFKGNEFVKKLALDTEIKPDVDFEIHQIEELLHYTVPDIEYFGFDKHEKLDVYLRIVGSAFRQFRVDLIQMKQKIEQELPEAKLDLANIKDALEEVERVLSAYPIFKIPMNEAKT